MLKTKLPIIGLALMILIVPHVARLVYYDNFMPGEVSYYHAGIARDMLEGKAAQPTAYHYLLAMIGSRFGILTASNVIPFIAGMLSVIVFYMLIARFNLNRTWICVFWIVSPLFVYGFTMSEPMSVVVLLMLTGAYLYTGRNPWISIIPFGIIPLFGYQYAILTMILLGIYAIHDQRKLFFLVLVTTALVSILYPVTSLHGPLTSNLLQDNLIGLGAVMGFNIFVLVLSVFGLIHRWKQKKELWFAYAWLVVLVIAVLFDSNFKIFLNLLISIFAVEGLVWIYNMDWELRLVRNLTLFILGAGILYSSTLYIHTISFAEPHLDTIDALYWLKANTLYDEVILSHPSNNYWIHYFSDRNSLSNPFIFSTRDEKTAVDFFMEHNIRYVFADKKTQALMINDNNIIGLEFIMENSDYFQKVREDIEIWRFKPKNHD